MSTARTTSSRSAGSAAPSRKRAGSSHARGADEIFAQARQLPVAARGRLVCRLLESIEEERGLSAEEWSAAWGPEVERRLEEVLSGKTSTIPAKQVLAELRRKYGRSRTSRDGS